MKQTNLPHSAAVPDDVLFRSLPKADCPICCLPLPTLYTGKAYKSCCGQELCKGCLYSAISANRETMEERVSRQMMSKLMKCPFCRAPPPRNGREMMERIEKRAGMDDPLAIHNLACAYDGGDHGLPRNPAKALQLWSRAGELGSANSYYNLGQAYLDNADDEGPGDTPAGAFIVDGGVVRKDQRKAQHYYELAASKGHVFARHNLGCIEEELGHVDRALKHYKIAAEAGDRDALDTIRRLYARGGATKSDYAEALRAYQAATDEIRSAQRDAVAAWRREHRYLE